MTNTGPNETPRMAAACRDARGIDEGCKLELELAAANLARDAAEEALKDLQLEAVEMTDALLIENLELKNRLTLVRRLSEPL
jgi:hypothetical protein